MAVVVSESRRCDWRGEPTRWLRRKRRDGSLYSIPIEFTSRCDDEAVVTKRVNGRSVHRCVVHLS